MADGPPAEIIAFGPAATRWAGRLTTGLPVIVCEPSFGKTAFVRAFELRRAGKRFLASIFFEDLRLRVFRAAAVQRVGRPGAVNLDTMRAELDVLALDSLERDARTAIGSDQLASLHELIRLSSGVLVRSWAEYHRLRESLGTVARDAQVVVVDDPTVPAAGDVARTEIVVWGAGARGDALTGFVTAFQDVVSPVTFVADDPFPIPGNFRFVTPNAAGEALARARVIVDATANDPGTALALARLGKPLAVSVSAGSAEFLQHVATFEPWSRRSILAALGDAYGMGPPAVRRDAPQPGAPIVVASEPPAAARREPLPVVSVVVSTYNRPGMLAHTLDSIDRQTYPAIEVVVVNDAGSDVRDVVAEHPRARLFDHAKNRGPAGARNTGMHESTGEYVTFFDDDDEMFPDHVATLVAAHERSGLDLAYGQMINCFLIPDGHGGYAIDALQTFDALLDHADIQWGCGLAVISVMFRRSLIPAVGDVDESLVAASDYEFYMRLAANREGVRVPDVTAIYNWRMDASNRSAKSAQRFFAGHSQIYEKHPTARTLINDERAIVLAGFAKEGERQ